MFSSDSAGPCCVTLESRNGRLSSRSRWNELSSYTERILKQCQCCRGFFFFSVWSAFFLQSRVFSREKYETTNPSFSFFEIQRAPRSQFPIRSASREHTKPGRRRRRRIGVRRTHTHTRLHLASYTTIAEASKKLQDVGEAARAWLWLRRGTTSNQPTHTRS